MTTGPSEYLINQWLDATFNNDSFAIGTVYIQLHVGDPGGAGTLNVATETTRKALSSATATAAGIASDAALTWPAIAGSQDPTHWSAWDVSSGGNFLGSGLITSAAYTAGQTFTIPIGDFTINMTPAASSPTGGTITIVGAYTYHTFTAGGTFDPAGRAPLSVDYIAVGAGGAGSPGTSGVRWGGGGASGVVRQGSTTISTPQTITIGVGGTGTSVNATNGGNGTSTVLGTIATATGGNGGSANSASGATNADFAGGSVGAISGAAGAGSGAAGSVYTGGNGVTWNGNTYARGGAGINQAGPTNGSPGVGGGGTANSSGSGSAGSGAANTGDGGGPCGSGTTSGNGGSGVAVIRYLT